MNTCELEWCERAVVTKQWCKPHYDQQRKGLPFAPIRKRDNKNTRRLTDEGYIVVKLPNHPNVRANGWLFEHVVVMSTHLNRALTADENVHHKNGVRDDNRLENLELWTKRQPAGQRIEDQVEWAIEILKLYAPEQLKPPY